MKMLFIANARIPTEKAHGYQIVKTLESLMIQGEEVLLLLPERKNSISQSISEYYHLKKTPQVVFLKNRFGFLEKNWKTLYFILQRIAFGPRAFFFALFFQADVIFSREITLCFFLSLFKKNVVFEDHEPKQKWRGLYRFFVRHLRKKIVVAHSLVDLYNEYQIRPESYKEVPNGVEKEVFDAVSPNREIWKKYFHFSPEEKVILYIGHFYPWKGVYTLVESAAFLSQGKVVCIGGLPGDREKLQSFAREKKINNVFFHEFVPHDEVIPFLKSADIVVLPNTATEERSQKYTTPIKLFEYMASKVPIVASQIQSFTPYLTDKKNCLLFTPDDPHDLSKKLEYILSHEEEAKNLATSAYTSVDAYTWEKRAKNIISFI